eukprot:TRINITY_DN2068_c0_g1_i1.p1 TRINITY_DN2068_c0_g1~~TRINITY_DN2068_c0_g1_i1.p1  ORF type:complete len:200 (-),score=42.73 TRINITY_DN2068_c0_g1_i1:101-643(-)
MAVTSASAMAIGVVLMQALAFFGPSASRAAWGWQISETEAPHLLEKQKDALWSCKEDPTGLDGGKADAWKKENAVEYGDPKLHQFFMDSCKCTVVPKPGYKCDIEETALVGKAKDGNKKYKEGEIIQGSDLGPHCTNKGYPGATIDCILDWLKEPVCKQETAECAAEARQKQGDGCCSLM